MPALPDPHKFVAHPIELTAQTAKTRQVTIGSGHVIAGRGD